MPLCGKSWKLAAINEKSCGVVLVVYVVLVVGKDLSLCRVKSCQAVARLIRCLCSLIIPLLPLPHSETLLIFASDKINDSNYEYNKNDTGRGNRTF